MLIKYDLYERTITPSDRSQPPAFTVSAEEPVGIDLLEKFAAKVLPSGAALKISLKEKGAPDADSLGSVILTEDDVNADLANRYEGTLNLVNDAVNDLLKLNGDPSDDVSRITCVLEVAYRASDLSPWIKSLTKHDVMLIPAYGQDDDAAPIDQHYPAPPFLRSVIGLTGGGATKLDGIATVGLRVPFLASIVISDVLQHWLLRAGTDAEDGVGIIRPDDYDASTNAKVWILVS
jgi:hypothetical protein